MLKLGEKSIVKQPLRISDQDLARALYAGKNKWDKQEDSPSIPCIVCI